MAYKYLLQVRSPVKRVDIDDTDHIYALYTFLNLCWIIYVTKPISV